MRHAQDKLKEKKGRKYSNTDAFFKRTLLSCEIRAFIVPLHARM